jgi:hypothetical protein
MKIVRVFPHQLAWLRRPELDTGDTKVWELPDGTLFAAHKDEHVVLEIMKDGPGPPTDTGTPDD